MSTTKNLPKWRICCDFPGCGVVPKDPDAEGFVIVDDGLRKVPGAKPGTRRVRHHLPKYHCAKHAKMKAGR